MCKKDYSWNPTTCICKNSKCLQCIIEDSVIVCDKIINTTNIVSTNVTNIIPTNDYEYCVSKFVWQKSKIKNGLLYFPHSFISDHINTLQKRYIGTLTL